MTVVRELGFMEARMHLLHSNFYGSTQGGLALRIEGDLDLARLTAALEHVQSRYEILSCVIEEREGTLCFVKTNQPLPLSVRHVEHDSAWRTVLAELNDEPLAASTLWRVVVLSQVCPASVPIHDVLLIVHHAIMDGSAADTFFEAVLKEYADPGQGSDAPAVPVSVAAEHAVPPMLQLEWETYTAWLKSAPALNAKLPALPYHMHAAFAERQTVFDTVQLNALDTAGLEQRAKAAGSTLNSWLSAVLVQAVGAHTAWRERLAVHSTFSLRRLCASRIKSDDIACCMAIVTTDHALPAKDVAALAVEHHTALAKAVLQQSKQAKDYPLGQLRSGLAPLAEVSHFALDLAFTFGESRLKAQYGPLRLVHLYPVVNRRAGNLALAVHGVRFNGRCYLTFNHTAPLQSRHWTDKVHLAFVDALQH